MSIIEEKKKFVKNISRMITIIDLTSGEKNISTGSFALTSKGEAIITAGHTLRYISEIRENCQIKIGHDDTDITNSISYDFRYFDKSDIGLIYFIQRPTSDLVYPCITKSNIGNVQVKIGDQISFCGYPSDIIGMVVDTKETIEGMVFIGPVETCEPDQFSVRVYPERFPMSPDNPNRQFDLGGISGSPAFILYHERETKNCHLILSGIVREGMCFSARELKIYLDPTQELAQLFI